MTGAHLRCEAAGARTAPLGRRLCRDEELERAAAQREVTVTFNADVTDGMPWRFVPAQRSVKARTFSPLNPGPPTLTRPSAAPSSACDSTLMEGDLTL